jgi:hypothetical protein
LFYLQDEKKIPFFKIFVCGFFIATHFENSTICQGEDNVPPPKSIPPPLTEEEIAEVLKNRPRSKHTKKAYDVGVNEYKKYLPNAEINVEGVLRFLKYKKEKKASYATLEKYLKGLQFEFTTNNKISGKEPGSLRQGIITDFLEGCLRNKANDKRNEYVDRQARVKDGFTEDQKIMVSNWWCEVISGKKIIQGIQPYTAIQMR